MKKLVLLTLALAAFTPLALADIVRTPAQPAGGTVVITTTTLQAPVIIFQAGLSVSMPIGVRLVSTSRVSGGEVFVVTPMRPASMTVRAWSARPAYVIVYDSYDAQYRRAGWVRSSWAKNGHSMVAVYHRGGKRMNMTVTAHVRGASVNIVTSGR